MTEIYIATQHFSFDSWEDSDSYTDIELVTTDKDKALAWLKVVVDNQYKDKLKLHDRQVLMNKDMKIHDVKKPVLQTTHNAEHACCIYVNYNYGPWYADYNVREYTV